MLGEATAALVEASHQNSPFREPAKDVACGAFRLHPQEIRLGRAHADARHAFERLPKPRSFADVAWQASVTDDQIKKAIVFGGAAVGKSPMMPAQPQLKGNDAMLDGLVQIVRGFKGK